MKNLRGNPYMWLLRFFGKGVLAILMVGLLASIHPILGFVGLYLCLQMFNADQRP